MSDKVAAATTWKPTLLHVLALGCVLGGVGTAAVLEEAWRGASPPPAALDPIAEARIGLDCSRMKTVALGLAPRRTLARSVLSEGAGAAGDLSRRSLTCVQDANAFLAITD